MIPPSRDIRVEGDEAPSPNGDIRPSRFERLRHWVVRHDPALPTMRRSFVRNVSVLGGGTALSQVIGLLVAPVLTRLYTPADFGLLGAYAAVLALVGVIASLRYEIAIPLPSDDGRAANLLALSLILVTIGAACLTAASLAAADSTVGFGQLEALRNYLWLLPVGLLGLGAYQALEYWAVRQKAFGTIARTSFARTAGQAAVQLGMGVSGAGPLGLLLGHVVGQAAGIGSLAARLVNQDRAALKRVDWSAMWTEAKRFRRFPILSSGGALLNQAGLQMPALLLATLYDPRVAGWFVLSQRVIATPMRLLGRSVGQVYVSEAATLAQTNPLRLRELFTSLARRLFVYVGLPMLAASMLAPAIFRLVFGNEWTEAGAYVRLLAFSFALQIVAVPLSQTLNLLERQDLQLYWDAGRVAVVGGGLICATLLGWGAREAIALYAASMAVGYALLIRLSLSALSAAAKQVTEPSSSSAQSGVRK